MAETETETPASELRYAAWLLRERVAAFRREAEISRYWQGGTYAQGIYNACGGAGGRLAMLFTPEAAEELAALFEHYAAKYELVGERFGGALSGPDARLASGKPALHVDFALAVARVLNGGAS